MIELAALVGVVIQTGCAVAGFVLVVSPDTGYKLIYAGRLKTVRVGRRQLVRRESVLELLADFAAETAAA